MPLSLDRTMGCLYGAAFGDALGARTEFVRSIAEIRARFPPDGPRGPHQDPWPVTDDTQLMLACAQGLQAAEALSSGPVARTLSAAFVRWLDDPENNRAPGATCLRACEALAAGADWRLASQPGAKGCGANMRVQPIGLLCPVAVPEDTVAGLAQLQAALTHGHPTALAASDLTAHAIRCLATGTPPAQLLPRLWRWVAHQERRYPADFLGTFWERSQDPSAEHFTARGWAEVAAALERLERALHAPLPEDPCDATGEGWVAEEALATALLCFLSAPEAPQQVLCRAAVTRGDSDSIACLAGALAGAWRGLQGWPAAWCAQVEYARDIEAAARWLAQEGGARQL